jgi:hypothetical protein
MSTCAATVPMDEQSAGRKPSVAIRCVAAHYLVQVAQLPSKLAICPPACIVIVIIPARPVIAGQCLYGGGDEVDRDASVR